MSQAFLFIIAFMHKILSSPKFIIWLILLTTIAHFLPAYITPLSVDEAHYALYGLHVDWSYFDHPPLVGWLQALALQLGNSEWQLRLFAMLSYAISLWLIHTYTYAKFQRIDMANIAALLFTSIPLFHLLGIGLVPDSLLMPLVIALLWQAEKTLNTPSILNWLALGLLLGLSALAKYTSIFFAIGLLGILIIQQHTRYMLQPGFWIAIALAAIATLPVLFWNSHHDWISFTYQLDHGAPQEAWQLQNLLQSQGAQLLVYTPLVWALSWWFMLSVHQMHAQPEKQRIWIYAFPALAVFTFGAGKEPSLPHWLAFFYLLWLPITAHFLMMHLQQARWKWLTLSNIALGLLITLASILLMLWPALGKQITPNPTADITGWKEAALAAKQQNTQNLPILVSNWVDASRIAWYAQPMPVIVLDNRYDQFDIWFGSPKKGLDGMLLLSSDEDEQIIHTFQSCQLTHHTNEGFKLLLCHNWLGN